MHNTRPHAFIAGLLAIAILIGIVIYGAMHRSVRSSNPTPAISGATTSNAITSSGDELRISGGTATVKETTESAIPAAPNYKTPLALSMSASAEVKTALTKQFNATVAAIEKNQYDFDAWVNLGTLHKMAGDYQGAATLWTYVGALYPGSTVPWDNLGELYLDFLKNYPKAEADFKKSIALNPQDINAYQQLFSLYTTYGYKAGTAVAADLVAAGLKANPSNQTLLQFQQQLRAQ